MGRKVQNKQHKQDSKTKQNSNLNSIQKRLQPLIDKLLQLTTLPAEQNISKCLELQNEINQVIDQVTELEREIDLTYPADIRCSSATLDRFTKWMKENGAKFDGTKIAEFPGYELGLQADVDIQESSLVIAVPRRLMLTVEAARNSPLKPLVEKDPLLSNMPNVVLAIFVLLEKFKENSFWKPYIDILPTSYSTVLYFSLDELKELQGSPTLDKALKQIKNIARQYAYFYKLIWTSDNQACKILRKHFTYNQYR
ncbi:hypothetical protein ILUMI_13714 [Ignelater luminosus]|uniref:protein-histidine N-methyltransferase n=1 Tax=Ignelater luminosus TaxID=2038154 RepID=A0A8K0CXA1_IGNLU|nr:hypothetical protein ILUMI_13714 [Ignelater luminosus]